MSTIKCPSCGQSVNVPEKKTGLWWGIGCLIAAVGLPIILAVVGLLAAIAIPSFVKARDSAQRNACVANLRTIEAAKEGAAAAHSYREGEAIPEADLSAFVNGGFERLVCPKGGRYIVNPAGRDPECSVHGSLSAAKAKAGNRP